MCREYTHGFNALAALEESVLDHYTQALYDGPGFQDTHTSAFSDSVFHFLFPRPHLMLDHFPGSPPAVLELEPLVLRIQDSLRPSADTPILSGSLRVVIRRPIGTEDGSPVLLLGEASQEDVEIEILEPAPGSGRARALIEAHLDDIKGQVCLALHFMGDQTLPLGALEEPLLCDSADPAVLPDDASDDRDALHLGMYSGEDELTTRGTVDDVAFVLEADRTFELQISGCLATELFQRELDRLYMRFEMEVPEGLHEGETHTDRAHEIEISPVADGGICIEGLRSEAFASLHGTVGNPANGDVAVFDRADDGTFSVTLDASVGDTLEFHGDHFVSRFGDYNRVHLSQPTSLTLQDGEIRIDGELTFIRQRGSLSPVSFLIEYSLPVAVDLDPRTGELRTEAGDVDIDLTSAPVIFWFTAALIGLFGGAIAAICLAPVKRILIEEITESGAAGGGLPGLDAIEGATEASDWKCFVEAVVVHPGGIDLSGIAEAGRIESAGQAVRTWTRLTEEEDLRFSLDLEELTASSTLGSSLARSWSRFEELGIGEIEAEIADVRTDTVSLSIADTEATMVFVVGLPGDRVAKVQLVPLEDGEMRIRWVTYEPSRRPTASLEGLWSSEITDMVPAAARVSGATRYQGEFTAVVEGLHESLYLPDSPGYVWTIDPAYGRLASSGAECTLEIVTAEDLPDDYAHHITLTCVATDVFGRSAGASTVVTAQRLSSYFLRPRSARDTEVIRIRPEEPAEAGDKKVVEYEAVMAKVESAMAAIEAVADAVIEYERSEEEQERHIGAGVEHGV